MKQRGGMRWETSQGGFIVHVSRREGLFGSFLPLLTSVLSFLFFILLFFFSLFCVCYCFTTAFFFGYQVGRGGLLM